LGKRVFDKAMKRTLTDLREIFDRLTNSVFDKLKERKELV
jgi:hypothetical protein